VAAILTGTLGTERLPAERTLGLEITPNPNGLAVLHYDTEQSEAQLHKNLSKTLQRASLKTVPEFYHSLYLASLSRKDRLKLIRESMDLIHNWLAKEPDWDSQCDLYEFIAQHSSQFAVLNLIMYRLDSLKDEHRTIIDNYMKGV